MNTMTYGEMKERGYLMTKRDSKANGYTLLATNGKGWEGVTNGWHVCYSYGKPVAKIRLHGGEFVRLWDGYTGTTLRHVNEFRENHGLYSINKKGWDALKVA